MKTFKICILGWHTDENPKGPILREELIEAADHFDAWKKADQIWRVTPGSIAYKVDQI